MDLSREPSTSFNFAQYYTDIGKVIPKTYFSGSLALLYTQENTAFLRGQSMTNA